jgi:endonuclease/exonuclease/phosphatase family metal-dependent hydrolase
MGGALTWYVPDSTSDSRSAEKRCLATGPVEIDSTPAGRFGAWQAGDSLAVVAWNVSVGGGDLLGFLDEQMGLNCGTPGSGLAAGSSHFVLLLQEAYRRSAAVPAEADDSAIPRAVKEESRPGERVDVVEAARRCGLALAYVPATRNGTGEYEGEREDKGNAILSTLPLADIIAIEMPMVAQRRVELAATLRDARGDSLRVVSVHLNTFPPPWRLLRTGGSSRVRQALTLVDALERAELERSGGDEETASYLISTVAGGDINTWTGGGTALKQLYLNFPDSPPYDPTPTRTSFRTDHILFRRAATGSAGTVVEGSYRRFDSAYYSDHHPITVWFRFGP